MTQTDRNPAQLSGTVVEHGWDRLGAASRRTRWWRELVLVGAVHGVYDLIRGFIGGGTAQAQQDAHDLALWERELHLDAEHWLNDHLQHVAVVVVPACFFYATLHPLETRS